MDARQNSEAQLAGLMSIMNGTLLQKADTSKLAPIITAKLVELQQTIDLANANKRDEAPSCRCPFEERRRPSPTFGDPEWSEPLNPHAKPVKIVMIEDDEGHARLIEKNIRRAGVGNEIIPFVNGTDALNYVLGDHDR